MIFVLTHYTENWKELFEVTFAASESYCLKNKYSIAYWVTSPYEKYTGLEKLKLYRWLNDGDIGLFLDCDAMITNYKVRVEDFIDDEHDFYVCEGMNMGVFILRKSKWSDNLIEYLKEQIQNVNCNCEQDAIEKYVKEYPEDNKIKILPHPAFNSYKSELYPEIPQPKTEKDGQWVVGSYILHLPALSLEKRIDIFKNTEIIE